VDRALAGYWASPWPGEDGGPTRRQRPRVLDGAGRGLDLGPGARLRARSRQDFAFGMVVLREPGEVFVFGHTMGGVTTSWVERIDPESLVATQRSPDLAGGPFWAGGMAAHANGSLYVTYGRWCHRLAPDCSVIASRELPRDRPYNSLVILPDGHLVIKDFAGGDGVHALPPGMAGSELVVLEPERLEVVDRMELDQGSIARLSAGVDVGDGAPFLHVVGDRDALRVTWDERDRCLSFDSRDRVRYRTMDGQTFGWDPVLTADSAWFLDNGEGSTNFGPSFRGKGGASTAPLHLVRAPLQRGSGGATSLVVCEEPGGLIANPPIVDDERQIAIGYDSAHGVMRAWRFTEVPGDEVELWSRAQDHASHCILYGDTGEVVTADFDHDAGVDEVVVLDIETGAEKARVATESPLQSVLFPCPGWDHDLYVVSFTTLTHVTVA
jgi:hypothetical protein